MKKRFYTKILLILATIIVLSTIVFTVTTLKTSSVPPNHDNGGDNTVSTNPILFNSVVANTNNSSTQLSLVSPKKVSNVFNADTTKPTVAGFIFSDNDGPDKDDVIVEVFMTFGGIKSSDMMLNSVDSFKAMISDGKVTLIIYPVFSDDYSSTVIPNSIAFISQHAPEQTWVAFEESLALSSLHARSSYSNNILDGVNMKMVEKFVDSDITQENIINPPFNDWFSSSQKLFLGKTEGFVPTVFVNGQKQEAFYGNQANILQKFLTQ